MFCTWPRFESEGFWNSEMAYFRTVTSITLKAINRWKYVLNKVAMGGYVHVRDHRNHER